MNRKSDYIAVFDSGVGGISVLRQLEQLLPRERFLYYGDSANAPYGTRPTEEIRALAMAAAEKLVARGLKALVVACNTATAAAIRQLRSRWPELIIVGIEPALKPAADRFPGGTVGVMATPATLREAKFSGLLEKYQDRCRFLKLPAPGLVELVEDGMADSAETDRLLETLLGPWKDQMDALVLGCTHYPLAEASLRRVLGQNTVLLEGGEGTARETRRRLAEAELLSDGPGSVTFENSLQDPRILELSRTLLRQGVQHNQFGGNFMEKPDSLIFDIDGTLWDNREVCAASYSQVLAEEGYPNITVTAQQLLSLFGKPLTVFGDVLLTDIPDRDLRQSLMVKCAARSLEALETSPDLIGYPGIRETLETLSKSYRLFIVSNSEKGYPEVTMRRLGIGDLISGHMCYADTGLPKGDTIRRLMQDYAIPSAAYIGDTQGDYEATLRAGVPFVWCEYGFGTPEGYAARIRSFPELLQVFPG